MKTSLSFRPEHIRSVGRILDMTTICYKIAEPNGDYIGQVNVQSAFGLMNEGHDIPTWIADRLNELVETMGEERVRDDLSRVLDLR